MYHGLSLSAVSLTVWLGLVFRDLLLSVCDEHAKIKQRKVRGHDISWMNCDIRETMVAQNRAKKHALRTKCELDLTHYKQCKIRSPISFVRPKGNTPMTLLVRT